MKNYDTRISVVKRIDCTISGIILLVLLTGAVFVGSSYYDLFRFTEAGIRTVAYHDFRELEAINPDTVAWIELEGTKINHPVVQGKDNFEYLDRDFRGNDYAGGCIFLDEHCSRDLSGRYLIIHGHHMAHGAMFGDLAKFLDPDFFRENGTGRLLTRDSVYDLLVVGACTADAYDSSVYGTDPDMPAPLGLLERCDLKRDFGYRDGDRMVLLSTCSGDMTNERTAVFCRMRYAGENN